MHLNAQALGHHNHEVAGQQAQFGATTSTPHYSKTDRKSPELHLQNHQIVLPTTPMHLDFPWNNPIQIPQHQTQKESWKESMSKRHQRKRMSKRHQRDKVYCSNKKKRALKLNNGISSEQKERVVELRIKYKILNRMITVVDTPIWLLKYLSPTSDDPNDEASYTGGKAKFCQNRVQ